MRLSASVLSLSEPLPQQIHAALFEGSRILPHTSAVLRQRQQAHPSPYPVLSAGKGTAACRATLAPEQPLQSHVYAKASRTCGHTLHPDGPQGTPLSLTPLSPTGPLTFVRVATEGYPRSGLNLTFIGPVRAQRTHILGDGKL